LGPRAVHIRLKQLVDLVDAGRVVHLDLDRDRPLLPFGDDHLVDRRRRDRVDRDPPPLGRAQRAPRPVPPRPPPPPTSSGSRRARARTGSASAPPRCRARRRPGRSPPPTSTGGPPRGARGSSPAAR